MEKPKLQIALDCKSMCDAFKILGKELDDTVDIVECGTMLLLHEGLHAVDYLRTIYPDKILVADFKCVAPHFGSAIIPHKPNHITILSQAENNVQESIAKESKENGIEAQIELYREYTIEDVRRWKSYGIDHIIFNRPRERKGPWSQEDADDIKTLINEGMKVTATGGMSYENLDAIAGLPLYAIICGKSVLNAESPADEAKRIKARINELWK